MGSITKTPPKNVHPIIIKTLIKRITIINSKIQYLFINIIRTNSLTFINNKIIKII
jgi:hypothetical protein